ncbi:hypothetical protein FHS45_001939 [Thalassobacillus devorans]|nr:hypothetical protein [Thalassobacillus devorans]NIK28840.1 hypothetical protein [Thalassobacillus devorans]
MVRMSLSFSLQTILMPNGEPLIFDHGLLIVHEENNKNWFVMLNHAAVTEEIKQLFADNEEFEITMVTWKSAVFIGKVKIKNLYEEDVYMDGRAALQEPVQRVIELDGEKIAF